MKRIVRWVVLGQVALAVAGCSSLSGSVEAEKENGAPAQQYAATVHVLPYSDARGAGNPRKIGTGAENIYMTTLSGTDIVVDKEVAVLVTEAMKKRLARAGYQVVDKDAMFEMSGAVKELVYNVKTRDEVSIAVESTLKETASGKVLWSGLVEEKKSRFAGVAGNTLDDVVKYLDKELGVVAKKTTDATGAVLMAQHPELFHILPGTQVIPGVTVLNAPAAASAPAAQPLAAAAKGVLGITTDPQHAKVYIDDVYYGLSPLRLDMEPGVHAIAIELEGYRKATQKVSVRRGETTELELKLKKR